MTGVQMLLIAATIYAAPHVPPTAALVVSGVLGALAAIMWWKE